MPISRAGNDSLSSSLSMSSILLAPHLSYNLLSNSTIAKHHNYLITFLSTHSVLRNNITKITINIGKKRGGFTTWRRQLNMNQAMVFK